MGMGFSNEQGAAPAQAHAVMLERQRKAQVRAVGAAFFRFRALLVVPSAAVALVLFVLAELPSRQLVGLAVGFTGFCAFFVYEALRARRAGFDERRLYRSLLVTLAGLGLASAMSGGLGGPTWPLLFAPTVTTFAAFGWRRESWVALGLCALLCGAQAALPPDVPFPPIAEPWRRLLGMQFTLVAAALLLFSVAGLTEAFAHAGATLDRLREDAVDDAKARLSSVDALGAKVAHEVKNPLTAVKNLVELVASEVVDERSQRRLAVVRQEVERIEQILHGYLSFARPLEELQLAPVALGELARDVLGVLEVRAARAGVALRSEGEASLWRADGRRLRAAVLNVAVNALEASPAGASVVVRCGADAQGAWLCVDDEGPGLSDEALLRAGSAFYTDKPSGTGLGLTIARATLVQHGGTLTLARRPEGGTCARLWFPVDAGGVGDVSASSGAGDASGSSGASGAGDTSGAA